VPTHLRQPDVRWRAASLEEIGDDVGHFSTCMTDRYRHLIEGSRAPDFDGSARPQGAGPDIGAFER
jgi:hypothetical protein